MPGNYDHHVFNEITAFMIDSRLMSVFDCCITSFHCVYSTTLFSGFLVFYFVLIVSKQRLSAVLGNEILAMHFKN